MIDRQGLGQEFGFQKHARRRVISRNLLAKDLEILERPQRGKNCASLPPAILPMRVRAGFLDPACYFLTNVFLALFLRVTKAYAGAAAILVDELDASSFEGLPHNKQCCTSTFGCTGFYLSNSHDTDPGLTSEIKQLMSALHMG